MGIVAHEVKDNEFCKIRPYVIFLFIHPFILRDLPRRCFIFAFCKAISPFILLVIFSAVAAFPLTPAPNSFCLQPPFPGFCCWLRMGLSVPVSPSASGMLLLLCSLHYPACSLKALSLKPILSLLQLFPDSDTSFALTMIALKFGGSHPLNSSFIQIRAKRGDVFAWFAWNHPAMSIHNWYAHYQDTEMFFIRCVHYVSIL